MKIFVVAVLLFLQVGSTGISQTVPSPDVQWPVYHGAPEGTHYSSLKQINRENVSRLQVAWTFDAGDAYPNSEMECNPLVVNNVLYFTTPKVNVIALEAATGKLIWRFDPNVDPTDPAHKIRVMGKMRSRGVAYWTDGNEQRIFVTARQFLYSLDAKTGKPDAAFGESGRIDLRKDLDREPNLWVTMTSPGIIYKDLLIIGSGMAEALPAPLGDIRAYDVHTGKKRWSFHTIPRPGEFGYDTWPKDAWKYIGSANDWSGLSLDTKRGLVFAGTGSAASDFYGANRTGDNLFANSVLALKAETGERVWHYQTVRHDIWDRDLPDPPTLVTVTRDGQPVDAVAQTTKSGFVFLFDRETGKPLFPLETRKYPTSDVEGEVTADTQTLPAIPEPFSRQQLTADMLTQRTPQAHQAVLEHFQKLRSNGQFIPPSREGTIVFPGFDGGAEWGGPAFDPESHVLYVNGNEMAWVLRLVEQKPQAKMTSGRDLYLRQCSTCHGKNMQGTPPEFPSLIGLSKRYSDDDIANLIFQGSGRMPGFGRLGYDTVRAIRDYIYYGKQEKVKSKGPSPFDLKYASDGYNKFLDPDGYPAVQPPWGTLNAINLDTGKFVWKQPFGEYPELAAQGMANTGSENYGGPVVTAGGLLFIAATSFDKKFHAFDKDTGKLLWEGILPAAGNATPATYEANGRQFVVIAAGGGKSKDPSGSSIVAYALPQ